MRKRALLVLAFLAVCLIWGSTYLGMRLALESFPPFLMGALRFLCAGALLLLVARLRGEPLPRPVEWQSSALTGVLFFVIGNGLVAAAEQSLSSGVTSVMVATMPLWAAMVQRVLGARLAAAEVAGVLLGLVGVLLMNLGAELRASPSGTLMALLAPLGWALGSVASKRVALPATMMMRTAAQMLSGGAAMLVVSFALGEHVTATPTARAVLALVFLCFFGSVVAFSAYVYLLANVSASVATSYAYVNPVIALAIGIVWAGERIDAASASGALIVLGAVLLVARAAARHGARPRNPTAADSATGPTRRAGCVAEHRGRGCAPRRHALPEAQAPVGLLPRAERTRGM